jgi:tetraacyldisaccharide 4'-kinase
VALELLLRPLTPIYGLATRLRARAYRSGVLPSHRLPVPVVSVGNLTFGGTGKTPTVVALVRDLVRRGRHPGVLTRGYRRQGSAPVLLVGPDPGVAVARTGDEPAELARRLPGVPIAVDADRGRGAAAVLAMGADILLLDDGFQHLRLRRDVDLVLIDAGDPWGGGALPPRGRLREPPSALARATAVLLTKLPSPPDAVAAEIEARVYELAPGTPVLRSRMVPRSVRTPEATLPVDALAGRQVVAFAGVGRPGGFSALLEEAGAQVVASRWFPDHHVYSAADLEEVTSAARRHRAVPVTTAKDAVKLPPDAPVWVVEAEVEPLAGDWADLWRLLPLVR